MLEAIDVKVPADAAEYEGWERRAEAEAKRKAELLARAEAMDTDGALRLDEERRALEEERKELLLAGKPTTAIRDKLRRNLQAREDLAAEIRDLREAAGGIDAEIRAAAVKAAQAKQAAISAEAPALVGRLAADLEALKATVEEIEAKRGEYSRAHRIVTSNRQETGAAVGGPGLRGVQWSHRAWTALVEALRATHELTIDVPDA